MLDRLTEIDSARRSDKAEAFEALATSMPVGEHGRCSFLIAAGEHRQMRKEYDEARRLSSWPSPTAARAGPAHRQPAQPGARHRRRVGGRVVEKQLRQLVRSDEVTMATCVHVGDSFEAYDRLREAMRWFTMPLTWDDGEDEDLDHLCLVGRWRVRRRLELPADRFDRIAATRLSSARELA